MADFRKTKDTALKYMLRTTLPSFVVFRGHSHRPSSTMRFDASNDDREFHLPIDHRPPSYPPPGRRCRQFRATIPLPPGGEGGRWRHTHRRDRGRSRIRAIGDEVVLRGHTSTLDRTTTTKRANWVGRERGGRAEATINHGGGSLGNECKFMEYILLIITLVFTFVRIPKD